MFRVLILFVLLASSESVKLPSNFIKCNRKNTNWKECVFKAGVDGLSQLTKPFPEVNIPNVKPFFVPEVTLGAGTGNVQVNQTFKNINIYGLNDVTADKFEFDFDEKTLKLEGNFTEVKMFGDYKLDGKILLLPIVGEGKGVTTIRGLYVKCLMKFEEKKKKGKTYLKIVSTDMKMTPALVIFNFENLFNGDKLLGDNVLQTLNDNWQAVYEEVEEGHTEIVKRIFSNLVDGFFSKVSLEEAFD